MVAATRIILLGTLSSAANALTSVPVDEPGMLGLLVSAAVIGLIATIRRKRK